MFTRKYAAPEVVIQDRGGLSADIFSLGCVFLEMTAALGTLSDGHITTRDTTRDTEIFLFESDSRTLLTSELLQTLLDTDSEPAYYRNIAAICNELIGSGSWEVVGPRLSAHASWNLESLLSCMLSEQPPKRPTAQELSQVFDAQPACCNMGQVLLRKWNHPD